MGCSASRPNIRLITRSDLGEESESPDLNPANSKHASRAFSYPTPFVHHPPARKGDSHHLVSLTSSTYGSLLLVDEIDVHYQGPGREPASKSSVGSESKICPDSYDSFSPDSVINTWELMDGLDSGSDSEKGKPDSDHHVELPSKSSSFHCVNLDACARKLEDSYEIVKIDDDVISEDGWVPVMNTKRPLWKHLSEESFLSDLDANVVSSYRRALSSKQPVGCSSNASIPKKLESPSDFSPAPSIDVPRPMVKQQKLLLYFTSLRGIRKTYEDCCTVRTILKGFQVWVDERDISMDINFRNELKLLLGDQSFLIPQVFINGKHVGGIDEIKQLNDSGELSNLLKGFPTCNTALFCKGCGDARFVPCTRCGGSRKVFEEEDERFLRCIVCNENGLVRCPECSS